MENDTMVPMTAAEIRLMREIIAWRKANQIEFVKRRVYGAPYWIDSFGATGARRRAVTVDLDRYSMLGLDPGDEPTWAWLPVTSFGQGVDVLVAFGYLPVRFSSAYAQGWDTGRDDMEHPGPAGPEFRAIVPAVLL